MPKTILYWSASRPVKPDAFLVARPDAIILDLEDGCPQPEKAAGRELLATSYAELSKMVATVLVRVNGADTEDFTDDLLVLDGLPVKTSVVLPKPVTSAGLLQLSNGRRQLWCMAEELALAQEIDQLKRQFSELNSAIIGIKDLAADLGIPLDPDSERLREAANFFRAQAQDLGIEVIDGMAFGSADQVEQRCKRALGDGFDGVTLGRIADCAIAAYAYGQKQEFSKPKQEIEDGEYRLN